MKRKPQDVLLHQQYSSRSEVLNYITIIWGGAPQTPSQKKLQKLKIIEQFNVQICTILANGGYKMYYCTCNIAGKVYGHFGPQPLRSLSTSVLFVRTELAKDRSDKGPKWMSRSVPRTEVEKDWTKKGLNWTYILKTIVLGYTTVDRFEWTLHHCRACLLGNLLSGDAVCNCIFYKLTHTNSIPDYFE